MSTFRNHVAAAVEHLGSQQKLAEAMGCSQQQISYLLHRADRISAEMALGIELATDGKIGRQQLRPDLFAQAERLAS